MIHLAKGFKIFRCKCGIEFAAFKTVKVKLCPDCKNERYLEMQRKRYNPNRKAKRKVPQVTK